MSYAPVFAPEARATWAQLDVWLQEVVLDEVDRLADDPQQLTPVSALPGFAHEIVREHAGQKHYVFLVLDRDDTERELTIQRMGHVNKPTQ